jgi:hypothetical protein
VLAHRLDQILVLDVGVMLGGQHHGIEALDHIAVGRVAQVTCDFASGRSHLQLAGLAHLGLLLDQTVRVQMGAGIRIGFVAGIAEHQALVACALFFRLLAVHALVDVGRLLAEQVDDAAGLAVKADVGVVVADVVDDLARMIFSYVDGGAGGDFTGDDRGAGLDQGFAGHAGVLVLGQDRVQDGVGNLVGDLVRVAFGDGFGGMSPLDGPFLGHRGCPGAEGVKARREEGR